jgi:hypothetical protein
LRTWNQDEPSELHGFQLWAELSPTCFAL